MSEREVRVRLVADTSEYEAAMRRPRKSAKRLRKAMRKVIRITVVVRVERES